MRKLKLQMQLSINGYVAGPQGEMDWMTWHWDDALKKYVMDLTAPVDCLLLGRKLAEGFIPHWESVLSNPATADEFSRIMVESPKIVFSKTLQQVQWNQTTLAKDDLVTEVNRLKQQPGGDIIVYGGANFVTQLIAEELIDEMHFFINPAVIGNGMTIFDQRKKMKLIDTNSFDCGIVVLTYQPDRNT